MITNLNYSQLPPIYFYLNEANFPKQIPNNLNDCWRDYNRGIYNWTLQTYLHLKAADFPCDLISSLPQEGIVLAHRDTLTERLLNRERNLFIICLKAERDPHPDAQIQVIQNPCESKLLKAFWNPYFIPHWTQPGLIPRDAERNDIFENVAYLGHPRNLAVELQQEDWRAELQDLGLNWYEVPAARWHDYSQVDATLSVRSFQDCRFDDKPATKLYNSWHAGVPALLGRESAFQAERKSELDYIEVKSPREAISALKRLRDDLELRRAIVERGKVCARETQTSQLVCRWQNFLLEFAIPLYQRWCKQERFQKEHLKLRRTFALKAMRLKDRLLVEQRRSSSKTSQ